MFAGTKRVQPQVGFSFEVGFFIPCPGEPFARTVLLTVADGGDGNESNYVFDGHDVEIYDN